MSHDPKVEAYLQDVEPFANAIFVHLRGLIHTTCPGAEEVIKWGNPHFEHHGENLVIFAAYAKHCSISFWKDALMADPRLKANADLPAAKRFMGKLTSLADLPPDDELVGWIKEAMSLNERGVKLPLRAPNPAKATPVETPMAFAAALTAAPAVLAIFESKSASFRKEYNLWIGEAKTDATRDKRIAEAMAWIAEGKGRFWKYAKGA